MPGEESYAISNILFQSNEVNVTPISLQRQQWNDAALSDPLPDHTTIEPTTINDVPCEYVTCGEVPSDKLLIHVHGGGFLLGSCITHRKLSAYLSKTLQTPVLQIDYRLAPEHPYPAGLNDVVAVYSGLLEQGYQSANLFLSGDSAGGGLVVSTLLMLREMKIALPKASVLMSPWLDLAVEGETITSRADRDLLITGHNLRDTAKQYIDEKMCKDPLVSPIYADLSGLPPFLIQVGDDEVLLSDSTRFAERAQSAGVDVTLEIWDDVWHVWQALVPDLPEAEQAIDKIKVFIQQKR